MVHIYSPLSWLRSGLNVRLCCCSRFPTVPLLSDIVSFMPPGTNHWLEMVKAVSTLSSTVTIHERMYSEPLNGIPTPLMTTDGAGTAEGECPDLYSVVYNYDSGHNIKAYLLLCTAILVSFLSVKVMFSSGMEMVTLQVYTPPWDVSSGEKTSGSDTTEPAEFSHCTVGGLVRLAGT